MTDGQYAFEEVAPAERDMSGWPEVCCDKLTRWESEAVGKTCGGLMVRGWWVCRVCGVHILGDDSHEAEAEWTLNKGGRSIDTGAGRLRVEGGDAERTAELMARLLRLPELEREVERLRRQAKP